MVIKIGNIQLTEKEAETAYYSGKRYIVAYRRIYALEWCTNYINKDGSRGGLYGREIYYHEGQLPLMKRGRFMFADDKTANRLIGHKLLKED